MKSFLRSKNAGIVFFGFLIVTAVFLFISDAFSGGISKTVTENYARQPVAAAGESNPSLPSPAFEAIDWKNTLEGVTGSAGEGKEYHPAALRITTENSEKAFRTYVADLKTALAAYTNPRLANEVEIMMRAYDSKDEMLLDEIRRAQNTHRATVASLLKVQTPAEVAVEHANLMNALSAIIAADDTMILIFTNPTLALEGAKLYGYDSEKFYEAIGTIGRIIEDRGVRLTAKEKMNLYLNVER